MSKDIIYREDAIEAIHDYWKGELSKMPTVDSEYGEVIDGDYNTLLKHNKELSIRIKGIPSADRPQGEWIIHFDDLFPEESSMECSVCHEEQPLEIDDNFCPNCGARMKGANDEIS